MEINKILVERYRIIHQQKFGEEIDYKTAEKRLKELAELVRLIAPYEEQFDDESI